jgi:hypothetical protein
MTGSTTGAVPEPTEHAKERWHERALCPGFCGLRDAWRDGAPIPIEETTLDGDGARYHGPTETVLIRRRGAIVTVLDARQGQGRRAAYKAEWDHSREGTA